MSIVASIADQGQTLVIAGQVACRTKAATDQQLVGIMHIIQIRLAHRTCAIDTFKIKSRFAKILESLHIFCFL